MSVAVLIVAAGRGSRAASAGGQPKPYLDLGGTTVLARSIAAFTAVDTITHVRVVIHSDDTASYASALDTPGTKLLAPAVGGETRQESVRLGLQSLAPLSPRLVLIHDAARPFVSRATIEGVIAALETAPGAIAAVPLSDTLKRDDGHGAIGGTVRRAGLWRAQTPQGFHFDLIHAAHRRAQADGLGAFTDDAALAEWAGHQVVLVAGSERNVKLTTSEDIAMARQSIESHPTPPHLETRTGTGFDVHRFAPGGSVWLCGIEIPHVARLDGHSDADVGLHALTDAILGAIGAGDIGQHFPPTDVRWKDAASHSFLRHAADLVARRGGHIVNVDITILAEAPRIAPHRAAMCARVAEILGIDPTRASVKATTTEGLGFTGRREGIAAMASASICLPAPSSTTRNS